jgi:hypothetical protein
MRCLSDPLDSEQLRRPARRMDHRRVGRHAEALQDRSHDGPFCDERQRLSLTFAAVTAQHVDGETAALPTGSDVRVERLGGLLKHYDHAA